MKTSILFLFIMSLTFSSCAQKWPVKNIYAYKTERMPGTIRVNENGEQISPKSFISYQLYAESTAAVLWQKAWIAGKSYAVTASEITQFPLQAGVDRNSGKAILIKHKPGVKLFEIALVSDADKVPAPSNASPGKIILKGIYKNKVILKTINNVVDLYVEPSV